MMQNNYLRLSRWEYSPHINYYHLFNNCLVHVLSFMEQHNLTKDNTYLYVRNNDIRGSHKFFNDVLSKFIAGIYIESNNSLNFKPITVDIHKYKNHSLLFAKLNTLINNHTINNYKIVFIKRSYRRILLNEQECICELRNVFAGKYDIHDVSFEELSFEQQIDLVQNAKLLVGTHGAGFANLYFTQQSSAALEIFPESFFTDCYQEICKYKDISHSYINGKDLKKPSITLDKYLKEGKSNPKYNNPQFRSSIRDVKFSIDIKYLVDTVSKML